MKTISVLGLGYGFATAVLFADAGFEVTGFDINTELINSIIMTLINLKNQILIIY